MADVELNESFRSVSKEQTLQLPLLVNRKQKSHITVYDAGQPLYERMQDFDDEDIGIHNKYFRINKMMGAYSKTSKCPYAILTLVTVYHILNITFAVLTFPINRTWCVPFKVTLLAIQIISALLYFIGFCSFNCNVHANSRQRKIDINTILQTKYKPAPCCVKLMVYGLIAVSWLSSFVALYQTRNVEPWRFYAQIVLYVLDLFKWIQTLVLVFIIYGFLNTFQQRFDKFQQKIERVMEKKEVSVGDRKESMFSFGASVWDHHEIDMCRYDNFDHCTFMEEYHLMTDYYIVIMTHFHWYIVVFCVFNIIMFAALVWSMYVTYSGKIEQCQNPNLTFFYVHYVSEILLYFVLWFSILWRLNRNHAVIQHYKYLFTLNVAITNVNNSHEKLIITEFLNTVIEKRSPFAIFGSINPTNERVFALFVSIVFPFMFWVYHFSRDTYTNATD